MLENCRDAGSQLSPAKNLSEIKHNRILVTVHDRQQEFK